MPSDSSTTWPRRLPGTPIGRCIYCGATNGLTDEHVIPFALGGALVLPAASCPACADMTSRFERNVLRGFMMTARIVGGFPTRRPKERPKFLPLNIKRGDAYETDQVPVTEFPAVVHLPQFEPAAYLHPRQHGVGIDLVGYEAIGFGPTPGAAVRARGGSATTNTEDWDVASYVRLLAKIALGLVVDTYGYIPPDGIPILPIIRGALDDAGMWIGSANFRLNIEDRGVTHASGTNVSPHPTDPGASTVFIRLKLFANTGATGAEIVVWTPRVPASTLCAPAG